MKTLRKSLLVVVIGIAGQLSAQPVPPAPPVPSDPPVETPPPIVAPPPTAEQMEKTTATLIKQVPADLNHIQALQSFARKQKDSFKLDCVNEQYLKAKASANRFDAEVRGWNLAVEPGARVGAFQKVTQEGANVHQARQLADRCVGRSELTGDNATARPQIPDDPTAGGTEVGAPGSGKGGVEPPAISSPYN